MICSLTLSGTFKVVMICSLTLSGTFKVVMICSLTLSEAFIFFPLLAQVLALMAKSKGQTCVSPVVDGSISNHFVQSV